MHPIIIVLLTVCAALLTVLILILLLGRSSMVDDGNRHGEKQTQSSVVEAGAEQEAESEVSKEPESEDEDSKESSSESEEGLDADHLYVHFIDVGQGDATLFVQGEHAMLVDTGSASSTAAASTRDLLKYLEEQKIRKLDYLLLTHGHEDHIGRAIDVMREYEIGQLIADFGNAEGYVTNTMDMAEYIGLDILKPEGGEELELGDAKIEILTGRVASIPASGEETTDVNNQSIGIRATFGDISFLLYGDGENSYEKYLLSLDVRLKSDVLKVPHHGFEASLCDEILDKIHPKFAVISSAKKSNFGFPSDVTLQKLGLSEVTTFCTNRLGNIVAETDGTDITWSTNDKGK